MLPETTASSPALTCHIPPRHAGRKRGPFLLGPLVTGILLACAAAVAGDEPAPLISATHFETHIRPVLVNKCLKCHGADKQEGGLRLDSAAAMRQGGDSGPAVIPGDPAGSLLMQAIRYDGLEMPPTGQLAEAQVQPFEQWIAAGAEWPATLDQLRRGVAGITEKDREWWAFQPVRKPAVPDHPEDQWSANPVDRFVWQRLEQEKLTPSPTADRTTLVRRLYFDVVGVPPTPEEIKAFIADKSPSAWENLVDRLLADSRYGEHWARFWLDLVRFSESDGWNQDAFRPHLWRYRDYVVDSFNLDKPYPEFVTEQLAGDEIDRDNPQHLAAAGFLRLGIYEYNQRDARGQWNDIVNEMTDVTADVFLGLGVACARCHDHKFDPIPQTDYYQLRACFEPVVWRDDLLAVTPAQKVEWENQSAAWQDATRDVRAQIDQLLKPYNDRKWKSTVDKFPLDIQACFYKPVDERTSWEHQMAYLISRQFLEEGGGPLKSLNKADKAKYDALEKELAAFDHLKPKPLPQVMTVSDFPGTTSPTLIPDIAQQEPVAPGILTVLKSSPEPTDLQIPRIPGSTGRRTALAQWIGRNDNPLTTRVIVNRIWQQHFGEGLVATASDFGHQGQTPSHPELLDWLTATFVENGWQFKQLHRLILLSSTWQQSARHPAAASQEAVDPAGRLLWRSRIRRLKAEQVRDAMLAVSGELQMKSGGPSVETEVPRRALYVRSLRNTPDPFLQAFDLANGLQSTSERSNTTTPTQSLLMVNGKYTLGRAEKLAERLQSEDFASAAELLTSAFELTWGRTPDTWELQNALEFTGVATASQAGTIQKDPLVDLCHVLFNSNEFLYVD